MGQRQTKPRRYKIRNEDAYNENPPRLYNQVPVAESRVIDSQLYDTTGKPIAPKNITRAPMPTIYEDCEYVDVVGSDSGNLTVFSWITQLGTCCASLCTLVVLLAFVVWMFLNRSINTLP